jgi:hypothetical protein
LGSAGDSVSRDKLWRAKREMRVEENIVNILQRMCTCKRARLNNRDKLTGEILITVKAPNKNVGHLQFIIKHPFGIVFEYVI